MKHIGLLHQQPIEEHHFVGREQIVAKANDVNAHRGFDLREHRSTGKRGIHVFKLDFRHLPDGEIEQARCFSLNIDEVWSKGSHLSANATRGRRTFVRGETPFGGNARAACPPPIVCGAQSIVSYRPSRRWCPFPSAHPPLIAIPRLSSADRRGIYFPIEETSSTHGGAPKERAWGISERASSRRFRSRCRGRLCRRGDRAGRALDPKPWQRRRAPR